MTLTTSPQGIPSAVAAPDPSAVAVPSSIAVAVPSSSAVRAAADSVLRALTAAGPDDLRWEAAGPLVSAAALRLRQALGSPVTGTCVSVAPVVREADFAAAARPLLGNPPLADTVAGRDFIGLALEAALALS